MNRPEIVILSMVFLIVGLFSFLGLLKEFSPLFFYLVVEGTINPVIYLIIVEIFLLISILGLTDLTSDWMKKKVTHNNINSMKLPEKLLIIILAGLGVNILGIISSLVLNVPLYKNLINTIWLEFVIIAIISSIFEIRIHRQRSAEKN